MELLCIKTHDLKYVIAGNTYIPIETNYTTCCGSKIYYFGHTSILTGGQKCMNCGDIDNSNENNIKIFISSKRFIEIGSIDESSTYETKEQLIEKL